MSSPTPVYTRSVIGNGTPFRSGGFTLFLAAASALGVALVLARGITHGVALNADSLNYLVIARNLLAGEGFINYRDLVSTRQPPLYPLLLAAASLRVFDPVAVAGPLNAAVFGLTIFALGHYLRQRLESRFLVVWACLAVALSIPLAEPASWVLSDPVFILLATLALIRTDRFLAEGKTSFLVQAAVCSALAWQTRYIGVTVPVAVGLLLLFQPGASLAQRARRIGVLSLIVAVPMGLWLLRGYLAIGEPIGIQREVDYSIPEILRDVFGILWSWVYVELPRNRWLPLEFLPAASALLFLAAVIPAAAGCIFVIGRRWTAPARLDWRPFRVFGGFAATYLVLLVAAIMLGNVWNGVLGRYAAPLHVPLLVAAVCVLDRCFGGGDGRTLSGSAGGPRLAGAVGRGWGEQRPGLPAVLLAAALSLWLAVHAVLNAGRIVAVNLGALDVGYSAPRWTASETLRYVRDAPILGRMHSNERALIHFHTRGAGTSCGLPRSSPPGRFTDHARYESADRTPACGPPARHVVPGSATGRERLEAWLAHVPEGAYVVWFNNWWNSRTYDYGAAAMRALPGLEPVAELADGAVFRVDRDYAPGSNPYRSAYASIVSGASGDPAARSTFDVYLDGATLTYLKEPCTAAEVQARFFLHVRPADAGDLPAHRRRHGFDNLGFGFNDHGLLLDGACLAVVALPKYDAAGIGTGQYVPGEGRLWKVEIESP